MEQQIRDALSLPEPVISASSLVNVIKQQPTAETVAWLAELYESLATEKPSRAEALAESLVLLRDSPDIPTIAKNETHIKNPVLNLFLYEVLSAAVSGPRSDLVAIAPTNESFLVGSVISTTATKHGLCTSAARIGAIARGIHFPGSEYQLHSKPKTWETSSLGACLQLLISGSVFCNDGQLGRNREQLLPSIKSLLAGETIKDANGKKLLQVGTAAILRVMAPLLMAGLGHDRARSEWICV